MPASADTGGGQAGQWSQVPAPEQLSARQTVASVALDDGSVWSVGGYLACGDWACRGSARIQRWDGAAWTDRQVPQDGRSDSEVTGYAPVGSDAVLVALRVWNP